MGLCLWGMYQSIAKNSTCQNRDEICHLGTVCSYFLRPLRFFWDRRTDIPQSKAPSSLAGSKKKESKNFDGLDCDSLRLFY